MSENTANLDLPLIMPSQAQKHVTHNEALLKLDAAAQLRLTAIQPDPPAAPADGECFAIAADATGAWTGREGRIAVWQDGAWAYLDPRAGWRAWNLATARLLVHDGAGWQALPLPDDATCQTLGISATASPENRLSVAAPATLLNHSGGSHRLKINKAAPSETASLLFQSGWSGRAEMGLAGNDDFSIKVSDGAAWKTALAISPSGAVRKPETPAFRAWRAAGTSSPANGERTGFTHTEAFSGTVSLGAALSEGSRLVVPATGIYLIALQYVVMSASAFELALLANDTTELAVACGGDTGSAYRSHTLLALSALTAGDTLCLGHTGTAQVKHGPGRSFLSGFII